MTHLCGHCLCKLENCTHLSHKQTTLQNQTDIHTNKMLHKDLFQGAKCWSPIALVKLYGLYFLAFLCFHPQVLYSLSGTAFPPPPSPVTPYTPTLFLRYQNIRPPKFDGNDNVGVRFNKCSMISKKTKKEKKKKRKQILAIPKAQDGVTRWHMKLKCTPVKSCTHLTEFTCVHLLGKTFGKSYSITKYYQLLECRTLYTLMLQLFCVFPRAKWKNWARLF